MQHAAHRITTSLTQGATRVWQQVQPGSPRSVAAGLSAFWQHHWLAIGLYALLSIALAYPLPQHFTTHILGGGGADPHHNLWILWHTLQVLQGQQPPFFAPYLYYPIGASLLTHGLGPVTGIFALPFWPLGPEAAHNGAVLISLWLTGLCSYLLAIGVGLPRRVALFAGTMLLVAPICLAGLYGHMTKVFLGGLPLTLLALLHALNPQRSAAWALGTALALLLVLLHSGYQFLFAGFAGGFFTLWMLAAAVPESRWRVVQRALAVGGWSLLLVGPLLLAIFLTARNPALQIDANAMSTQFQVDATFFFLPSHFSAVFGGITTPLLDAYEIRSQIDSAVALSWVGLVLCGVAVAHRSSRRQAWPWLVFTLICVVLAFGPYLQWAGQHTFTPWQITVPLPYAWLIELPGLEFVRLASRFLMIGYVTFVITAAFGLHALLQHVRPARQSWVALGLGSLLLLESWPQPWPLEPLKPVPDFYQQIASDAEMYGVFDLPLAASPSQANSYVQPSAYYQIYQMTHHKGIAGGYLSRTYAQHPLFPEAMNPLRFGELQPDFLVDGQPSSPQINFQNDLARYDYRYVVWHKNIFPDTPGQRAAIDLLDVLYHDQPPLVDDELVRVYPVEPHPPLFTLAAGDNWYQREEDWRWAASPATLEITSPTAQQAWLDITPATIFDPAAPTGFGNWALLTVSLTGSFTTQIEIIADQTTTLPLHLPAGRSEIVLSLPAGNFRPEEDTLNTRELSFAIRTINLRTQPAVGE
jgi:hypothetical protein